MTIADAARATRKYRPVDHVRYSVGITDGVTSRFYQPDKRMTWDQAQAACDRLNLLAVLESDAIRSPSERMVEAGEHAALDTFGSPIDIYRAMIDVLIAEVREAGNGGSRGSRAQGIGDEQ